MLKIDYVYYEDMVIEFDGIFKLDMDYCSLNEALEKTQEMLNKYGFAHAEIQNACNTETIATVEKVS